MEVPPPECFEVMWARTEHLELAGQGVQVPSKALGILILALHAHRAPHLPACRQELEFLADIIECHSHAPAILEIAITTGSLAAMRLFLEGILPCTASPAWPALPVEWRNRLRPGNREVPG